MKKIKIREIRDWLKGLEENKWRRTYIVDAKRIAHFARNIVNDCNDPLPSYLSRREGFSYSRAKQLAEKYVAKLREEEEQENQIRQEIRKIAKSILKENTYNTLRNIIQDEIKLMEKSKQLENDKELENSIREYMKLSSQVEKIKSSIDEQLRTIASKETEIKTLFKLVKDYMERFNLSKKEVDEWIAKLEKVLKYKVPRPDYKDLWEEAISKVNTQTKRVLEDLMNAQLELKKNEKKIELTIEFSLKDILKSIVNKFKALFNSITGYEKVVKKLPQIK